MIFYSKTTGGFYDEDIHGPRKLRVVDPAFKWPQIEVENPDFDPDVSGVGRTYFIDDPEVVPPIVEVANPQCKIPEDAKEISKEHHAALLQGQSEGNKIVGDSEGFPLLIAPPPVPFAEQAAQFMGDMRATRELILNRLTGIGVAAVIDGDAGTSGVVSRVRQQLLDITEAPAVVAAMMAENLGALEDAVAARYKEIAAAAPPAIRSVFNQISV